MSWLTDFTLGQRPDMRLPGYAEGQLGRLQDYFGSIGLGMPGRQYKSDIKQFEKDPLSLAAVSTARNAVNEREAGERTGQGANALISQGGGEQATLLSHIQENERAKRGEQYGLEAMNEAYGRRGQALQGLQGAINDRRGAEMGTLGMMSNLFGNAYNANRMGGIFSPDTISKTMQAFAGGAGAGLTAGGGCWIAMALYGDYDPRVSILRAYIFTKWAWESRVGKVFATVYRKFGQRVAAKVKSNRAVKTIARTVFDRLLRKAEKELL